ncbi:unnamed protein product [Durusdinium trenchii]|uniref:YchJ-like middle NTF2-like domain-containing protein n=1 Tax=Durusdinium trenchii TaxID=1381693 RepID=A0ABP0JZV2_9DINO
MRMKWISFSLWLCALCCCSSWGMSMPILGSRVMLNAKGFGAAKEKAPMMCPCLSGKLYKLCCRGSHKDPSSVASPEQLARARYSALALKKYDFLIDTTHHSHPEYQEDRESWKKTMARNNRGVRYVGLNITGSESRAEGTHAVTIEAASEPEKMDDLPKVLLVRECSIYRYEGTWQYAKAEELKREVVQGAGSARQLSGAKVDGH